METADGRGQRGTSMRGRSFEEVVRVASWPIAAGLSVQLVTCFWNDALSFVTFAAVGGVLTAGGVGVFLWWLAVRDPELEAGGQAAADAEEVL